MHKLLVFVILIGLASAIAQARPPQTCQPPAPLTASQEPNIFTEEQESDLGDAIAEQFQRDYRVIDDEELVGYLSQLGGRIIKHLPTTHLRFQFFIVDLPEANAFVLPGGRIYVSRKLIAFTQAEDELAGVISHEIGHLVARQGSLDMTRLLREVLGVTQVTDRQDIFDKYHRMVENLARKPGSFRKIGGEEGKNQIVADQIGLFAMASAGYDPQAFSKFWDRFAETKGNTGSFLSDLFGTTKPEAKRLREMIKQLGTLPPACIESRVSGPNEGFQKWQSLVVAYTGAGRKESLHNVLSKTVLTPALRGEITHIRFSPDGKFVLAQDDSGISVLTRQPFAFIFRIDAVEANFANFSPDSQEVVLYNSDLRVEEWSVADHKLKAAHEMIIHKDCIQTALSPDGKTLACLDGDLGLELFDVSTSAQIFQKKEFYTPSRFDLIVFELNSLLNSLNEFNETSRDWIHMGFSPDGKYFVAGQISHSVLSGDALESTVGFDITARAPVNLRGQLKKQICYGFTFIGPDRLVAFNRDNHEKSAILSFPAGEVLTQLPIATGKLTAAGHGPYLLMRPIAKFPVGVFNLDTKAIVLAGKNSAIDVYDQVFVSERANGELGLYKVEGANPEALLTLPRSPLGRLRANSLSSDLKWLAVSERSRGAVWDLTKGERLFHVRGFRGGFFSDDGIFYADFPKFENTDRNMAKFNLGQRQITLGQKIDEYRASQHGQFLLITKWAPKKSGGEQDKIIELQDARTMTPLWARTFTKETPTIWLNSNEETMVLAWPVQSSVAKSEIKGDPALSKRLASIKEKEGSYFLHVQNARTEKLLGQLLIETGKGSFRIKDVFVINDWVIIADSQNRVLVYSLSTGEQKGRVFGGRAAVSQSTGLLCVENESGHLTVYDLATMQKRDQFVFAAPVSLVRFSPEGKRLFVLTSDQTVYFLDMAAAPPGKS